MNRPAKGAKVLRGCLIAAFWLCVWAAVAALVNRPYVLPSPLETARAFAALAATGRFYASIGMSLARVLAGYLLGMAAGTALGALTAASAFAAALLSPIRKIVRATPVISFIILVLLFMSAEAAPLFIAFLMVLPIAWTNVEEGARAVDAQLVEMGRAFRFTRLELLRYIYAPSIRPQYLAAAVTALGFAWKSGVAAEVIASTALSIGRSLYESKLYVETPELFAWTAVTVAASMLMERLVVHTLKSGRTRRAA